MSCAHGYAVILARLLSLTLSQGAAQGWNRHRIFEHAHRLQGAKTRIPPGPTNIQQKTNLFTILLTPEP